MILPFASALNFAKITYPKESRWGTRSFVNRNLLQGLSGAILLLAFGSVSYACDVTPARLRCEYLENPLGIDEPQPRLSWIVTSKQRDARQSAYQIVAASSPELLSQDQGDVWDSGRIATDSTTPIEYGGRPLKSGERIWWKVRVWDPEGNASDWSPPSRWEMGLLESADWDAKWIARNTSLDAQALPLLRRDFSTEKQVKQARIYVTGLGYYELLINGNRLSNRQLDPGFTRYDRRVLYSTYDVTKYLQRGKNTIGAMLGNGWFNVQTAAPWRFASAPWRASPRLLLQLSIEYDDGTTLNVVSDDNWETADGPILYSSIYGGETYDARNEQPGWDGPRFDSKGWDPAQVVDAPKGKLVAQAMPPIAVTKKLSPVSVTEPRPGVYLFDVGQNLAGVAELHLSEVAGQEIRMRYGERLDRDGLLDQSNIGVHVWKSDDRQRFQEDVYITKGGDTETWSPRFVYHGFRYVEVTGSQAPLSIDSLNVHLVHSDLTEVGHFQCSNPILNRIWENARWSYITNLHGMPTDCPHREKNGWTADAHLACEMGLWTFDGICVYEKWLNDIADEQQPDGSLPGIVPTSGWGYDWGNGPAWDSALFLVPDYLHLYYGDTRPRTRLYDHQRRYVDYLSEHSGNKTNALGLGDWSPAKTKTPVRVTSTAYHYQDALLLARTATLLGKEEEAAKYRQAARSIKQSFNEQFYAPATGTYSNGSQTAQSCALFMGLVDLENKSKVVNALLGRISADGNHIDTGVLGSKYLLSVLTESGHVDVAYQIASQRSYPGWGWWVDQGATTLWENWDGEGSQNHAFFGDCVNWYFRALAGINPDPLSPGFKHIIIRPEPVGDLTSASAEFESIRGTIKSSWVRESREFKLNIEIPANTTASVYLPSETAEGIQVNGKPLPQSEHAKLVLFEKGKAIVRVHSGTYRFSTTLR